MPSIMKVRRNMNINNPPSMGRQLINDYKQMKSLPFLDILPVFSSINVVELCQ